MTEVRVTTFLSWSPWLADFNTVLVWMVSILPLIFSYPSTFKDASKSTKLESQSTLCSTASSVLRNYYSILLFESFFTPALADGFFFLLEFEWQQVSRTLLSIQTDLNNAVLWVVSTRPLISKSSRSFNNLSVTVPRAPIGITVSWIFHSFFSSLARSRYLSSFWISFNFTLGSAGAAKFTIYY